MARCPEYKRRLANSLRFAAARMNSFCDGPPNNPSEADVAIVAFAQGLSKRLICVLRRSIDFAKAPPRLSALNIKISFEDDRQQAFEESLKALVSSIQRDAKWLRLAAQLTVESSRWSATDRSQDHLLRGVELRQAEDWAARRPKGAPEHSELLLQYLAASREAEGTRTTIGMIERTRFLELLGIVSPFLEEEVRVRELALERKGLMGQLFPLPDYYHQSQLWTEVRELKALLENKQRWHPEPAVYKGVMDGRAGYSSRFRFPCCDAPLVDDNYDEENLPPQFIYNGCQDVPEPIRYGDGKDYRLGRYYLVDAYRKLLPDTQKDQEVQDKQPDVLERKNSGESHL